MLLGWKWRYPAVLEVYWIWIQRNACCQTPVAGFELVRSILTVQFMIGPIPHANGPIRSIKLIQITKGLIYYYVTNCSFMTWFWCQLLHTASKSLPSLVVVLSVFILLSFEEKLSACWNCQERILEVLQIKMFWFIEESAHDLYPLQNNQLFLVPLSV